jgi:hypothetical protein
MKDTAPRLMLLDSASMYLRGICRWRLEVTGA